ncbi:MAG TPA: hypothetical protein VFU71_21450 [Burkholderiaceae bacterium]|nr:hypothetical protein [Burkholderiaceae bacterium]
MGDRSREAAPPTARRWLTAQRLMLLTLGALAAAAASAQPAAAARAQPGVAARAAFQACDAQAFLALNTARNYMMAGRNKELVEPYIKDDPQGRAIADEVYRQVDAGQVHHPGELAADALFKCAAEQTMTVGAPRQQVALCFTRTDIAFFLHLERSKHVVRQSAVPNVLGRLTSRELYPVALVNQVAEAVYAPPELPDLQQVMRAVAWTCINQRPPTVKAAPAASR